MKTLARHPDLYEILNVAPNATQKQISIAYSRLIKRLDTGEGGEAEGAPALKEKIALLQEAFDILSDERKRKAYNLLREDEGGGIDEAVKQARTTLNQSRNSRSDERKPLNVYEDYYGFSEKPFDLTPDPKYLYLSPKHKEVLAHLVYGLQENNGFLKIIGEVGTGKTTICRSFLKELYADFSIAYIFNPCINQLELLQSINAELGLPSESTSRKQLIDTLNRFLFAEREKGHRVVVIIDEAQDLQADVLEQLRLLSNLETETEKLIQIVLIGQPELDDLLAEDRLRQLRQRITISWELLPLNLEETRGYIHHRLNVALGKGKVKFLRPAAEWIFRYSHGIPRMINVIADRALLIAYTLNTKTITPKVVKMAIKDIGNLKPLTTKSDFFWRTLAPIGLGFAALAMGLHYFVLPDFNQTPEDADLKKIVAQNPLPLKSPVQSRIPVAAPQTQTPALANDSSDETPEPTALQARRIPSAGPLYITQEDKLVTYLSSLSLGESKMEAVKWMVKTWEIDADTFSAFGDSALERARDEYGLRSYALTANFEKLASLNYPAIIELALPNAQGTKYLALMSLQGDRGVFGSVDQMEIPLSLLDSMWTRKAIILWKDFETLPEDFASGFRGKESIWLQKNLRLLGLFKGREALTYGPKTINAVMEFQRKNQIPDDGRFDDESKMALYNLLDIYPTPKLIPQGAPGLDRTDQG
ncbi:MAG: AAA family ATPase [Candidatus Nitrohelix vancouverensis]|uniref:AAA family ATPase n=1 Tax=Candidatus Nitrohelix vancouverensis TaxID=2705534 RepID=A0A7T0C1D2_9BACT|nr:MAG: AAA family ATPase [Candidatus Nitrohelix vancouverensis]